MPASSQCAKRNTSEGLLAPNEEGKPGEQRMEAAENVHGDVGRRGEKKIQEVGKVWRKSGGHK